MNIEFDENEIEMLIHCLRIFVNLHRAFNNEDYFIRVSCTNLIEKLEKVRGNEITFNYPQILNKYFPDYKDDSE